MTVWTYGKSFATGSLFPSRLCLYSSMLSVVVFFSDGLMQLLSSPPFLLPIPLYSIKYISDKQ